MSTHIQCLVVGRRIRGVLVSKSVFAVVLFSQTCDRPRDEALGLPRISEAAEVLLDAAGEGWTGCDVASASLLLDLDSGSRRCGLTITTQRTVWCVHLTTGDGLRDPSFRRVIIIQVQLAGYPDVGDVRRRELGIKVCGRLVRLDDRLERWCHLLSRKCIPVNGIKERMLLEFRRIPLST